MLTRLLAISILMLIALMGCGSSEESSSTGGGGADDTDTTDDVGLTISANKKISADSTDRCDTDDIVCTFTGGQKIILSDSTVIVTAEWNYVNSDSSINDTDYSSATLIVPVAATAATKILGGQVKLPLAQGGSGQTRKMLITYTRATDVVTLVWDKDNSGTHNTGDVEFTTTLTDW